MATTYLTRTQGTPTDAKKYTFSTWVKLGRLKTDHDFMFGVRNDANNNNNFYFRSASDFVLTQENIVGGTAVGYFYTNRKFRDVSAWYNIQVVYNSTEVTSSNRVKVYVNGVQETSFSSILYPTLNSNDIINTSGSLIFIGQKGGSYGYLDGSMTHINFIDGLAYDASYFGETDSLTGIWKPITSPSVTYGTNGFFLKFASSGSMGTDSSGNSNNFTVNGNLTQTQDTPSNVYAVMNALDKVNVTLSNGNLNASCASSSGVRSTIAAADGKFYVEVKFQNTTSVCGVVAMEQPVSTFNGIGAVLFGSSGSAPELFLNGTTPSTYSSAGAFSANDIMQIALDMDSNTVYFGKNGSWFGGTSWTESTPTTGHTLTSGYTYGVRGSTGSGTSVNIWNFGNGYFGTTAVASAGTNASGIGIFEYDVPTGYTALSTKGLNL